MESKNIKTVLREFEFKDNRQVVIQLLSCVLPIALMMYINYQWAMQGSYGWIFLLSLPLSLFFIRLFIIFHDCAHHNYTSSRLANKCIGHVLGFFFLVPFPLWKSFHDHHHQISGNLDKRNILDVICLTTDEYERLDQKWKYLYRFYRSRFFQLFLYMQITFVIMFRLPISMFPKKNHGVIWMYNLVYVLFFVALSYFIKLDILLISVVFPYFFAYMLGSFIFFIQHQYEEPYMKTSEDFDFMQAGLEGSSFWSLSAIGHWFTGNIGFHHIHHLNLGIPNYHLKAAHQAVLPYIENNIKTVSLEESLNVYQYKLYDTFSKRMVGFNKIV